MNGISLMPDKLQLQLLQRIERIELPKNHIVLQPGQICDHYYYIEKGFLSCHQLIDEKDYCSWLMFPGDIATSVESFNNRVPSKDTIRTANSCILHLLSWKHAEDFSLEYPAFGIIRQRLTNDYYLLANNMILQKKRPPEKFYEYLKEVYGKNFQLIPRKLLAAHMGISETLLYDIIKKSKPKKKSGTK
jgi:hypothetical protein